MSDVLFWSSGWQLVWMQEEALVMNFSFEQEHLKSVTEHPLSGMLLVKQESCLTTISTLFTGGVFSLGEKLTPQEGNWSRP
jgi:hypothetical protein